MDKWWRGSQYGVWHYPLIHKQFFRLINQQLIFMNESEQLCIKTSEYRKPSGLYSRTRKRVKKWINKNKIWFHSNIKQTVLH